MNLQQIIDEADVIVPNAYSSADKVAWLNAINQDFFTVVKIPRIIQIETKKGEPDYVLPHDVRAKNIDLVFVGIFTYTSILEGEPGSIDNVWSFDDETKTLSLVPVPYEDSIGIVRYHRIASSNFTSDDLTASPDAPEEYHWIYVPALCAQICKAMDDVEKAAMYENDYRAALNTVAQNYVSQLSQTPLMGR